MTIYTIDTDLIQLAKDEADKVTLTPDAGKTLAEFQTLYDQFEVAREEIKEILKTKMFELDPNCTSVTGKDVKVTLAPTGPRYAIDRLNIDKLPKDWYTVETKTTLDTAKVAEFVKANNSLPLGIVEPVRGLSLRINPKHGSNGQTE